jgi:AcrR family transcriptional regulator
MGQEQRRMREKEQRKRTILKASRKLFLQKGFNQVTVLQIAQKSSLSKGAIYLYFRSKEEIYIQILLNDIKKFHERVAQIVRKERTASVIIADFSDFYIKFFLTDRELFRILINFMLQANNLVSTEKRNTRVIHETDRTISIIEGILQHGMDTGEFKLSKEEIRKVRNAFWGLLNGIILLHLFAGKEENREERIRNNIKKGLDIFIEGLKNRS